MTPETHRIVSHTRPASTRSVEEVKALAIKCFVFAARRQNRFSRRRIDWLTRGLLLWREATGEDITQNLRTARQGYTYTALPEQVIRSEVIQATL